MSTRLAKKGRIDDIVYGSQDALAADVKSFSAIRLIFTPLRCPILGKVFVRVLDATNVTMSAELLN
jgi:ABC-type thiamin/hydroxymethylpyrimidine transport system permease subunit